MCHLSAVGDAAGRAVPGTWAVGVFGSASRCPGDGTCVGGASDVDLLVVHPVGQEHAALSVRRSLIEQVAALELAADVTLLSNCEVVSTRFWDTEDVVLLTSAIVACGTSDGGSRLADTMSRLVPPGCVTEV